MHYDNPNITNLEIIYLLYKWINFFNIPIIDLSEVKSKEECLVRGTSMKFVNLFVTEVKKWIQHCESKCMQSIELKTNYKTESGIVQSLIRFIQSCMPRRKVCHDCIIVIKVQSLG